MLKKNYEFKIVLTKGRFYIGKQLKIVILRLVIPIHGLSEGGELVVLNFKQEIFLVKEVMEV